MVSNNTTFLAIDEQNTEGIAQHSGWRLQFGLLFEDDIQN
jgi:hypothetical protein